MSLSKKIIMIVLVFISFSYQGLSQYTNRITFYLENRRAVVTTTGSIAYHAELWATSANSRNWLINGSNINIISDVNYLDDFIYSGQEAGDAHPQLSNANGYGTLTQMPAFDGVSININKFAPPFLSLPLSTAIHIATARFTVLEDTNSTVMDNFSFDTSTTNGRVSIFHSNNLQLLYNRGLDSGFGVVIPTPRKILSCQYAYFKFVDCTSSSFQIETATPNIHGAARWYYSSQTGGGNQVYYQYDYNQSQAPSGASRTNNFDFSRLSALSDEARCRWAKQAPNEILWRTTPSGGRFWWGQTADDIGGLDYAESAVAMTFHAINPNNFSNIVDTANCGYDAVRTKHFRSEIIFNNTPFFYTRFSTARWTTDYARCGGTKRCIDFYGILLHEMGHYLGLGHDFPPNDVVNVNAYRGRDESLGQCDVDRLRALYQSSASGPPDNTSNCITSVKNEEYIQNSIFFSDLDVYPIPTTSDKECTVRYKLLFNTPVQISLANILGEERILFQTEKQSMGVHTLTVPKGSLHSGIYFVRLLTPSQVITRKLIIIE